MLRAGEEPALLELLDGWELADGWRGRDFFRRYLEDDPTYESRNVWVAAEAGALLACAQIFPRALRWQGRVVPTGGIGSVFTRADRRGEGLASQVLAAASAAMTERGFPLSLLFAERVSWYTGLGWRAWQAEGVTARLEGPGWAPGEADRTSEIEPFSAADLPAVVALHEAYSAELEGTVARSEPLWRASLRCAGNPDEDFLVARRSGLPTAYLRAVRLDSRPTLCEWARAPGDEGALHDLVRLFGHYSRGPAAGETVRLPGLPDARLRELLLRAGFALGPGPAPAATAMLRCLAPDGLAVALGGSRSGAPGAGLDLLLPRDRFFFWPADRF